MLGSKVRLPTIPSQDLSGVLLAEVDRRRHPGLSHMTTKEHHPNATALEVLLAIAPGGVIASDDSAFIDAVVFLRGQGLPPAGVEEIACEVRQMTVSRR
jgi:hypothetical protein